jgi:hypothetical protein
MSSIKTWQERAGLPNGTDPRNCSGIEDDWEAEIADLRAQLAARSEPVGEVVVTRHPDGRIVAVTRQDADGRILSVIAKSSDSIAQPAPSIPEPFAWIVVRDTTGEHDGGEPMMDEDQAKDYMENQCVAGWHLESIYRAAPKNDGGES